MPNHTPDDDSQMMPQRQALEAMSQKLNQQLELMIEQQNQRLSQFIKTEVTQEGQKLTDAFSFKVDSTIITPPSTSPEAPRATPSSAPVGSQLHEAPSHFPSPLPPKPETAIATPPPNIRARKAPARKEHPSPQVPRLEQESDEGLINGRTITIIIVIFLILIRSCMD